MQKVIYGFLWWFAFFILFAQITPFILFLFPREHLILLESIFVYILPIVVAVVGTVTGKLPGTAIKQKENVSEGEKPTGVSIKNILVLLLFVAVVFVVWFFFWFCSQFHTRYL
jgi:hypothetical protein